MVYRFGTGGTISDIMNPKSAFAGEIGETYKLLWTVSNNCGYSSDSVEVYFLTDTNMVCGQLLPDLRDSAVYKTVQVGSQCWMAENLNYGNYIEGLQSQNDNLIPEKYCYENNVKNCDVYGGLYRWNELMDYSALESAQGLCLDGWHVPSDNDWFVLENYLDTSISDPLAIDFRGTEAGSKLKWGGSSTMDMLLSGIYAGNNNFYGINPYLADYGSYASSSEDTANSSKFWYRLLHAGEAGVMRQSDTKYYSMSVRCVADQNNPCFIEPNQANAGPDNLNVVAATTQLNAVAPLVGTGEWSILQGVGGVISDVNDPQATYAGSPGTTYILVWTISNYCGSSSDTVEISFFQNVPFVCGNLLVDNRDNQLYNTVELNGKCWMAENLNFGTMINSSQDPTNNGMAEKYCFSNDPAYCQNQGGLYRWYELMQYTTQEHSQGLCPEGWLVPSDNDWFELENYLDPTINDPSATGSRGIDAGLKMKAGGSSGMEILYAGIYAGSNNFYGQNIGSEYFGTYASSSYMGAGTGKMWSRSFLEFDSAISRDSSETFYSVAVRCIKDTTLCEPQPSQADAGPNQLNHFPDSVVLAATAPNVGAGLWTSIPAGNFSDNTSATSTFYGTTGQSYQLIWMVSTPCGVSSDTMVVSFYDPCVSPLEDARDGKQYSTVRLGTQCWMAQNLNYGYRVNQAFPSSQTDNMMVEKYCYNDSTEYCDTLGGLYVWDEMMNYTSQEGTQGICPAGWHLPTDAEWFTLESYLDASITNLVSTGYRGISAGTQLKLGGSSGMDMLLGGNSYYGLFVNKGDLGFYASSTQNTGATIWFSWIRKVSSQENGISRELNHNEIGVSVRCLMDE